MRAHHPLRRIFHRLRATGLVFKLFVTVAVVGLAVKFIMDPLKIGFCKTGYTIYDKDVFPRWNQCLMHNEPRSQRTIHFPFRTGCPNDCRPYRNEKGLSTSDTEAYARVTVEWYFGEPNKYDPRKPWESQNGASKYRQGINFECPQAFVHTFQAAASEMKKQGLRLLDVPGKNFTVHKQKRMHASLSYLCCLDVDEAEMALTVIDKWIQETSFDFTLGFTEIQSWYESPNSVTTIVLVDEASQRTMMRMNHALNSRLESAGVPVVVPREDQMPFHSTVAGFRYSKKGETYDPTFEIESKLPDIYSLVRAISEKYRDQWTPPTSARFHIQHKPLRSPFPGNHTHALVDKS